MIICLLELIITYKFIVIPYRQTYQLNIKSPPKSDLTL